MSDVSLDRKRDVSAPPVARGKAQNLLSNLWDGFASYCRHQGLNSLSDSTLAQLGTTRKDITREVNRLSHTKR